jgi:hypothetical protein
MKINDTTKRILKAVIIGIIGVLVVNQSERYFKKNNTLFSNDVQNCNIILNYMNIAVNVADTPIINEYADSCSLYIKKCTDNEIDSLKNFISLYIKSSEDATNDVVSSIKDSGQVDTSTILRPLTIKELKEVCIKSNSSYLDLRKDINLIALNKQQERDTMKSIGNPKETTENLRNRILNFQKRGDSIYHLIYYRVFISKK